MVQEKQKVQFLETQEQQIRDQITQLQLQLESTRKARLAAEDAYEESDEKLRKVSEQMPSEHELELLRVEVGEYEDERRRMELRSETEQQVKKAETDLKALQSKRAQLDDACTFFKDTLPHAMIEASDLPVEGLGIEDDGISINGKPLDTLSGAERMQLAIRIAEAQLDTDGAMHFMLLDGIEQLDEETFAILEERAKRGDIQFIWTKVTNGPLKTETV